jgi:hypothetical protein
MSFQKHYVMLYDDELGYNCFRLKENDMYTSVCQKPGKIAFMEGKYNGDGNNLDVYGTIYYKI